MMGSTTKPDWMEEVFDREEDSRGSVAFNELEAGVGAMKME